MQNIIKIVVKKALGSGVPSGSHFGSATIRNARIRSTGIRIASLCFVAAQCLVQPVHALEFECSNGADNRFIRLELPGISHLCEVSVTNVANERQVKWYANHDTMFCSAKTVELKNKYQDQWGFQCEQWPDHDGVDQLNNRQRTILDAELKFLIETGKNNAEPFMVEGLKVAASPASSDQSNMLVAQFFLNDPSSGTTRDVTHIIRDDGVSWNTMSKIESLAKYIDANEGYIVNSALISTVSDNGAMEVITVLDATDATTTNDAGCYGNQMLTAKTNGELIARSPHRFICAEKSSNDAG